MAWPIAAAPRPTGRRRSGRPDRLGVDPGAGSGVEAATGPSRRRSHRAARARSSGCRRSPRTGCTGRARPAGTVVRCVASRTAVRAVDIVQLAGDGEHLVEVGVEHGLEAATLRAPGDAGAAARRACGCAGRGSGTTVDEGQDERRRARRSGRRGSAGRARRDRWRGSSGWARSSLAGAPLLARIGPDRRRAQPPVLSSAVDDPRPDAADVRRPTKRRSTEASDQPWPSAPEERPPDPASAGRCSARPARPAAPATRSGDSAPAPAPVTRPVTAHARGGGPRSRARGGHRRRRAPGGGRPPLEGRTDHLRRPAARDVAARGGRGR